MTKKGTEFDVNAELEELPAQISYQEQLMEDSLMEIEVAKNEKNRALAEILLKYEKASTIVQKAMFKKALADENDKILKLKEKLSKVRVEFNRLKNRFDSVRKVASLRIEEMKHGLDYKRGGVE